MLLLCSESHIKKITHRNTTIWKHNIVYYSLLACVTCIKSDMRCPKNKMCASCVSLKTNTVYRSQELKNQHQTCNSKYLNNFIRMMMAQGWLAPLTTGTFSRKSGTRWWNVCHPLSILCAQKPAYSYISTYSVQRKWMGWVKTFAVLDKATTVKGWKKFLSQVCAIMRGTHRKKA